MGHPFMYICVNSDTQVPYYCYQCRYWRTRKQLLQRLTHSGMKDSECGRISPKFLKNHLS